MKTKVKNTIILILALTVLCLSCYFIYDKKIKENIKKENQIVEADENTKKFLINVINKYGLDALSYEYDDIKFNNKLSNGILYLAFNNIASHDDGYLNHFEDNNKWEIDKSKFDDYFNHAYGFTPKDYSNIICTVENEVLVYYHKDTKKFSYNDKHPGHGYYGSGYIDYYITSYEKEKDLYTINVLFLIGSPIDGYRVNEHDITENIISSSNDMDEIENTYQKYFKEHLYDFNGIEKYQYVFQKVDSNYYLKEYHKVK
ncbi:MAG: hypothetical protein J6X02_03230 [Bacilli bacterium]|nr:hypothetical protein [Bacilli bacterium]